MVTSLNVYNNEPFDSTTQVDLNDYFLNVDGSTSTFTLSNKTNDRLNQTLQANTRYYYYWDQGYTKSGSYNFTTNTPPLLGSNMVAPGLNTLSAYAYDQLGVDGNPCSNVQEIAFYLGNHDQIDSNKFVGLRGSPGISLNFRDRIGYGATSSMCQIACATQDAAGTAMTYLPINSTMYTPPFQALSTVCANSTAGDTTLTLASSSDASTFQLGDYIIINKGGASEETTKLIGISGANITVTATTFSHNAGETVYDAYRKFWLRYTVPENFSSNTAVANYNVSLFVQGLAQAR